MLDHLKKNVGSYVSVRELGDIADIVDFSRGLRAMRQEGWDLLENGTTWWSLRSLTKLDTGKIRKPVDTKTRYRILQRDNSTCQRCGRTPADGVRLTVDHKIPVEWGGGNEDGTFGLFAANATKGNRLSSRILILK
jgi:hypothetical protein